MNKNSLPDINITSHLDFFLSSENFRLAWERVRYFDRPDSRDWIGLKVFAANRDNNLEVILQSVKHKTFEPSWPEIMYYPKQSQTLRPMAILPIKDRVVYQAIANTIGEYGRSALAIVSNRQSFANILRPFEDVQMFNSWKQQFSAFQGKFGELIDIGDSWVAETDIAAFYESIDHSKLFEVLENNNFLDSLVLEYFKMYLPIWASVSKGNLASRGIPQGCLSSDLIANVFLLDLDYILGTQEYHYLRYVDDIRLVANQKESVQRGLICLDRNIKTLGLILQTKKTVVRKILTKEKEFDRLSFVLSELDRRYKEIVIPKQNEDDTLSEPSIHDIASQGFDFDPDNPLETPQNHIDLQNELLIIFWQAIKELDENPYAERHLRYCLWRLAPDDSVKDYIIEHLLERPWIINLYCYYLSQCNLSTYNVNDLKRIMIEHNVYDCINSGLINVLYKHEISMQEYNGLFRTWLKESQRDWDLLSTVATVLGLSSYNTTSLVEVLKSSSANPIVQRSSLIQASKLAINVQEMLPILKLGVLNKNPIVIDAALYLLYVEWGLNLEKLSIQPQVLSDYCLSVAQGYDKSLPKIDHCYIRHIFTTEYNVEFVSPFEFQSLLGSDYTRAASFLWQAQTSFLINPSRYVSQLDLFHEELLYPLLVDKIKWKANRMELASVAYPDRIKYLVNNEKKLIVFAGTIQECHQIRSSCSEAHTRLDKVLDPTSPVNWSMRNEVKKKLCGAYQELATWLVNNP